MRASTIIKCGEIVGVLGVVLFVPTLLFFIAAMRTGTWWDVYLYFVCLAVQVLCINKLDETVRDARRIDPD